jgi:hypothetical protein
MKYINKETREIVKAFNPYLTARINWPKWGKKRIMVINSAVYEFDWIVLSKNKIMSLYSNEAFIKTFW